MQKKVFILCDGRKLLFTKEIMLDIKNKAFKNNNACLFALKKC